MKLKIAIIGLGYVGLPLAIEFGKKFDLIGYDIKKQRIRELKRFKDKTNEVSKKEIKLAKKAKFTSNSDDLKSCNYYIITVPTPLKKNFKPDLDSLNKATKLVSNYLKSNDTVIYESTVYPGVTDEISIPILEKKSCLKINKNFYVGYSPERINPGDTKFKLTNIVKLVSGSNSKALNKIFYLYSKIIKARVFKVRNIKTAEAAKIIENTQRDVNIALINEFSLIFKKMKIDTQETLNAAGTKWNFLNFKPGLVGGHCIGIDPYYLAHKSLQVGYNPKLILSGRKLNDSMPTIVGKLFLEKLIKHERHKPLNILVLGVTFKENCPDIRNTKVIPLINYLKSKGLKVDAYDPLASKSDFFKEYNFHLKNKLKKNYYDALILSVPHDTFVKMGLKKIKSFCKKKNVFFDLKSTFPIKHSDLRI